MKRRLRHPITRIREPFGKAGLTSRSWPSSCHGGGAYAAAGLTQVQKRR